MTAQPNVLYYGDNLDVLRRHIQDEVVDLVYLDPPFNSNADYNVLFREHGEKAAAQVQAFEDTWEWNVDARSAYEEVVEAGGQVADTMRAFRTMLGASDMLAYLSMMAPRLLELHRALKPTGTLYLHCDPTASHYLKLLLDAIFGPRHFLNEIIWSYKAGAAGKSTFGRKHDTILRYGRSAAVAFYPDAIRIPYADSTLQRLKYAGAREKNVAKVLARGGKVPTDVWEIGIIQGNSPERLGYQTQKPIELMERIVLASSQPGDLVLDPFCGCGTTIDAAQLLGRRWIGIDITHVAINLIKTRLTDRYGSEIVAAYRTIGEPTTVDDARVLAKEDPFQFQAWALGLVGARVAGSDIRGGDKGIDGRLYFHEGGSETRQIVFSVKAGHLVPSFVRDLSGVLTREGADIGVLISFEEPSGGMRSEAAESGFYESPWGKHARLQLRTVAELLDGRGIDYPHVTGANVTYRRASRARSTESEAMELFAAESPARYDSDDSN